jgi:hypothetical protein
MAAIQEHLLRHRGAPEVAAHEVGFDGISTDGAGAAASHEQGESSANELQETR